MANQETGAGMRQTRTASDIELAAGGATYDQQTGRLEATPEQIEVLRGMENNKDLSEAALQQIAERAVAAKEATASISLESSKDTEARLADIAARTAEIKQHLGQIELAVDLKNEPYVSRDERARQNQQWEKEREKALNPGGRPARGEGKGYYAGTLPTTAPKIEPKKSFFKGLFGGN